MNKYPLLVQYALRCRRLIVLSLFSGLASAVLNSIGVTLAIPIILSILDPSLLPVDKLPAPDGEIQNSKFKIQKNFPEKESQKLIIARVSTLNFLILVSEELF